MTTKTTETQIKAILAAVERLGYKPYQQESGDAKCNAQRNLSGRTHYVDDDTLRWHKSRVCSTSHLHGGLLFRVTCSDALDPDNRSRGFRSAVFDCFGTCVSRPDLDHTFKTSAQAIKASQAEEIDLVKHYSDAITSQIRRAKDGIERLERSWKEVAALSTKAKL